MYQVRPAHPIQTKAIWDYEESATPTMASQQSYPSNVQLPRKLQRPQYLEVPTQNIAAIDPELSHVPVDYVRRGLKNQANQSVPYMLNLKLNLIDYHSGCLLVSQPFNCLRPCIAPSFITHKL